MSSEPPGGRVGLPSGLVRGGIEEVARRLGALSGVSMIMVIGPGGEEVHRWYRTTADMATIKASPDDFMRIVEPVWRLLSKVGAKELDDLIIRAKEKVAIVHSAGPAILVVVADRAANLALLLIRSRTAAEEIARLMG